MSVRGLVKAALGTMFPGMLLYRRRAARASGVALTFDDGPHPENTPKILDCLARHDAKATFFLLGEEIEKHPGLVRRIHAAGHQVANHGYSHSPPSAIGTRAYVDEVVRTQRLLEDLTGTRLRRDFRPSYGEVTPTVFAALVGRGYRFVHWSVDSDDSSVTTAPDLASRVAGKHPNRGDIVLFHEDYVHTVDALAQILQSLQAKQLPMVAVSALS